MSSPISFNVNLVNFNRKLIGAIAIDRIITDPNLTIAVAAVATQAFGRALGNILGGNLINNIIIGSKVLYRHDSLIKDFAGSCHFGLDIIQHDAWNSFYVDRPRYTL